MDSRIGKPGLSMVTHVKVAKPTLTFDLGKPERISCIQIHSVDVADNVPQSVPADLGIPELFVIDGCNHSSFDDPVRLMEFRKKTFFDTGPIIVRNIPSTACRYVRLTAIKPYIAGAERDRGGPMLAFAEIELLSGERNIASGISVQGNFTPSQRIRALSLLTDERNYHGKILPIRTWMLQLARRHDLEAQLPPLVAELDQRYSRQKMMLNVMVGLALLLAIAIAFSILIERILLNRQAAAIRERLAADMHDELGGNLHAIGLLGDHALETIESPEKLKPLLLQLRSLTDYTNVSARNCVRNLTTDFLSESFVEEMRRTSAHIMANLEHYLVLEGEEHLCKLSAVERADMLLFYKECLVNISRHSEATKFSTHLTASPREVQLSILDNGKGLSDNAAPIPPSLVRRARLLEATVSADSPAENGTGIHLRFTIKRWRLRRRGK